MYLCMKKVQLTQYKLNSDGNTFHFASTVAKGNQLKTTKKKKQEISTIDRQHKIKLKFL